jgi:hypothetical protein
MYTTACATTHLLDAVALELFFIVVFLVCATVIAERVIGRTVVGSLIWSSSMLLISSPSSSTLFQSVTASSTMI